MHLKYKHKRQSDETYTVHIKETVRHSTKVRVPVMKNVITKLSPVALKMLNMVTQQYLRKR